MQNINKHGMQAAASATEDELSEENEFGILKDVLRMLPSGITLQDEQGRFLLMNDAAAAQFGIVPAGSSRELDQRRHHCTDLLRHGRATIAAECFANRP